MLYILIPEQSEPKSHEDNGAGEGINMIYVILKHRYEYFRMKIELFLEDIIQ